MIRTWIFQSTPTDFEIEEFIASRRSTCLWRVSRHGAEIAVGDHVFLWRAKGRGTTEGGIFGRAEVVDIARCRIPDRVQRDFWKKTADRHSVEPRALVGSILILEPKNLIRRSWLADDPLAGGLAILSQPQGTNFRVTDEQAARLDRLWCSVGQPWSRSELVIVLGAYGKSGKPLDGRLTDAAIRDAAATIGRTVQQMAGKARVFADLTHSLSGALPIGTLLERKVWEEWSGTKLGATASSSTPREKEQ